MNVLDPDNHQASLHVDDDGKLIVAAILDVGDISIPPADGAATEDKQDDIITAIGTANTDIVAAIEGITVPAPVGGATAAKQDDVIAAVSDASDAIVAAIGDIPGGGGGGLTDTELRATAVPVSVSGVATASKQDSQTTLLTAIDGHVDGLEASASSIDSKTPALGQALAAASVPVVLTSAQITTLTPPAAITGFATAAKQDTAAATLTAIDGHVDGLEASATSIDGKLPSLGKKATSGSVAASAKSGGDEYETVAASSTTQTIGATGAAGDYLEGILVVVATAATAQVQIKDGSNSAITVFPNSPGAGVGSYYIPLGLTSVQGAWQVTTGAGSSVIAMGDFT